jgi:hypothetical protein
MLLTIFNDHQLVIPAGWSSISTYLNPTVTDIETLMAPVVNELILMYDPQNKVYCPQLGINKIGNWKTTDGYFIKLENQAVLNICGSPAEDKTLNLSPGWNVIPVLSESNVTITDVFSPVADKVIILQEIAGTGMWYPAYGITTLETLHSGKAYLVKVTEAVSITFP